jgi:hypothetical protein
MLGARCTRSRACRVDSTRVRPSHPNPTFVTIAKRPFVSGQDGERYGVIWVRREGKYFCEEGLDRWNRIDLVQ